MSHDSRRLLARDDLDAMFFQIAAVEHAPVTEMAGRTAGGFAIAEIIFAADIQGEVIGHFAAKFFQVTEQAAKVIVVAVAHDKTLHFRAVDAHHFHVVHQRVRRVTEIEQQVARVGADA